MQGRESQTTLSHLENLAFLAFISNAALNERHAQELVGLLAANNSWFGRHNQH